MAHTWHQQQLHCVDLCIGPAAALLGIATRAATPFPHFICPNHHHHCTNTLLPPLPLPLPLLLCQVCGLKLVESQLLASLAAANTRSDAATLRSQRLSAALEAANTRLAASVGTDAATAAAGTGPSCGAAAAAGAQGVLLDAADASSLAAQVAQLQCQLLARSQEVYQLQDELLQAKQVCDEAV